MGTTYLIPSADIIVDPGIDTRLYVNPGPNHYSMINFYPVPDDGKWLGGYVYNAGPPYQWRDRFETDFVSGNPGDIDTVTRIDAYVRINFSANVSAGWWGYDIDLRKSDDSLIGTKQQVLYSISSPIWLDPLSFTELSLSESDLLGLRFWLATVGQGWEMFRALWQISEIYFKITYDEIQYPEPERDVDAYVPEGDVEARVATGETEAYIPDGNVEAYVATGEVEAYVEED